MTTPLEIARDALREIALDDTRAGYCARRALQQIEVGAESGSGNTRSPETTGSKRSVPSTHEDGADSPAPSSMPSTGSGDAPGVSEEELQLWRETSADSRVQRLIAEVRAAWERPFLDTARGVQERDGLRARIAELEDEKQHLASCVACRDADLNRIERERDEALREVKLRVHGMDVAQQQRDEARAEVERLDKLLTECDSERIEARAEVELWKTSSHPSIKDLRAENETLRDLLREAREQFAPHHDPLVDRIDAALKGDE